MDSFTGILTAQRPQLSQVAVPAAPIVAVPGVAGNGVPWTGILVGAAVLGGLALLVSIAKD